KHDDHWDSLGHPRDQTVEQILALSPCNAGCAWGYGVAKRDRVQEISFVDRPNAAHEIAKSRKGALGLEVKNACAAPNLLFERSEAERRVVKTRNQRDREP